MQSQQRRSGNEARGSACPFGDGRRAANIRCKHAERFYSRTTLGGGTQWEGQLQSWWRACKCNYSHLPLLFFFAQETVVFLSQTGITKFPFTNDTTTTLSRMLLALSMYICDICEEVSPITGLREIQSYTVTNT